MRKVAHSEAGNSLILLFSSLAFVVSPNPTFAQPDDRAKIRAFEQAKLTLRQHRAALLEIPGIESIKISPEATGFGFKVFVSETANQEKIPQVLQGIPVTVIIEKIGLPAQAKEAYQRAKAVRDRYKLQLSKLGYVQIVGQPGGQFILVVAVDSPRAQKEVPASLGGIEVRSYVKDKEPEMADPGYKKAKAIQLRYADDLLEYEGVVGFGITRKELVTPDAKEKQDGKSYVFYVDVQVDEDLLYVPREIEGIKVVSRVTGIERTNDSCDPPPAPCDHRLTWPPPAPMGVSTSNGIGCKTGTLGGVACLPNFSFGYVTCNHVSVSDGSGCWNVAPGQSQYQAGRGDTGCLSANFVGFDNFTFVPVDPTTANLVDAGWVFSDNAWVAHIR